MRETQISTGQITLQLGNVGVLVAEYLRIKILNIINIKYLVSTVQSMSVGCGDGLGQITAGCQCGRNVASKEIK